MKRALFGLFVLGLLLAIVGWLFDRALEIRWLARIAAPDYVNGTEALDRLEENDRRVLLPGHPGFRVLLLRWPSLEGRSDVGSIGRTVAFIQFGPTVTNDVELIARNHKDEEVQPRWRASAARNQLSDDAKSRVFWIGSFVFLLGMAISALSGTIEFLSDDRKGGARKDGGAKSPSEGPSKSIDGPQVGTLPETPLDGQTKGGAA